MKKNKVVLVGAGVMNLIGAYFLAKEGYELVLVDKAPPPGKKKDWKKLGCTFGGENVRMFSFTEADNYNEKGSQLYSRMDKAFSNVIDNGGWLVKDPQNFTEFERSWIKEFHEVKAEDAIRYCDDIYNINIASGELWDQLMVNEPAIFEGAEVRKDIFRIYSDPADFAAAQQLHGKLGSLVRVLDEKEVLSTYPLLKNAAENGQLGGCMIVQGFTLKVHTLCENILKYLAANGAEIRWNSRFSGIEKDVLGQAIGIWIDEQLESYDHYVLSLGAYAGKTLMNTQSHNQLHGVLGVWLTLPNIYPELKHSMKIHKTGHVGEDTNVTLIEQDSKSVLVLGSGYGYTGNTEENTVGNHELKGLYDSLKQTAQTYFPEAYEAVVDTVDNTQKYCIRSWTPTGLGLFETIPALGGGKLIVTGGNNTGGFTQAPHIAEGILNALQGQSHPIHEYFNPRRILSPSKFNC